MNYLIFNGIGSRSLNGLIISELPPIIKPRIRTETTEIEGKDGDIIDTLGYASYDKSIQIGLFGNIDSNRIVGKLRQYDIDKVAKFFSGSGDLTFSNEPDKVYKAAIYESIDFERLVRFRTAKVKFHVQPFKYLFGEQPVELEITSESNNEAEQPNTNNATSLTVNNVGLEKSKPIITLWGSGVVEISINTVSAFQLDFSINPDVPDEYLTVNSEIEECYKDTAKTLKNRSMIGEFPILLPGENIITWTGILTKIIVEVRSRWL